MNRLSAPTQPHDSSTHERAIATLAHEAHVPIEHVAQLYKHELAVLTIGASITGFLTILTTRKVREILRQRRHPARASEASAPPGVDASAPAQSAAADQRVLSAV
jgi:hypothetical protein